jgi:hypothetical protein
MIPLKAKGQKSQGDNFQGFVRDLANRMPTANTGIYLTPAENDFKEWSKIIRLFRAHSLDSCKFILAKYNYELNQLKDALTGDLYDIIKEKYPVQKGWGTYIYNRNFKKRLYIHVNHPLDDSHALVIGTELLRQLKGEWLLIGGTSRNTIQGQALADVGRIRRTIFECVHENLSDLTHISISIHSYDEKTFSYPISATDVIISNGKTSDDQWGISQISLAVRDSMRMAGFRCGLAMYDSGYARLAGGWNSQGVFSNDSVGFGHWLYLELSKNVRESSAGYSKLITAMDHALNLTGKKVSQQVNRAFGLVSPRVIRLDSAHKLFFPPENVETYRIVSYNSNSNKNDTIDIHMGNWSDLLESRKNITSVSIIDTAVHDYRDQYRKAGHSGSTTVVSKIVNPQHSISSLSKFIEEIEIDSSLSGDDRDQTFREPIQVHRIPLKPILQQTYYSEATTSGNVFRWEGVLPAGYIPNITLFEVSSVPSLNDDIGGLPRFLIPLTSSSYRTAKGKFIGVQMTTILVNEIARLISEYEVMDKDIGLLAEQSEQGDYYLRVFPSSSESKNIVARTR